jgi:hypothetical protein
MTLTVAGDTALQIDLVADAARRERYRAPGMVVIDSRPPGAEVLLDDQKVGNTPFSRDITPGQHRLELVKPLYYPETSNFEINSGETNRLPLFRLRPRFGFARVVSHPQGAQIRVDGKPVGAAPCLDTLQSGTHRLTAVLDLYHDYSREFVIRDGETTTLEFSLAPAHGRLEIDSAPESGARAFLDGVERGETPLVLERFPSGEYSLKVTKAHFQTVEEGITVTDGRTTRKTVLLSPSEGRLLVTAAGARIFLDDREVGTNQVELWLRPGSYRVRAEAPRHYPEEREVLVSLGSDRELKLEPAPILGSITVNPLSAVDGQPVVGAKVLVNGEEAGLTPLSLTRQIGEYRITIRHGDYLEEDLAVEVEENRNRRLEPRLQTYRGSLEEKAGRWRRRKWTAFAATVLGAGAAAYLDYAARRAYDDYRSARSITAADGFRRDTEIRRLGARVGAVTAGAAFGLWNWSAWHERRVEKELEDKH